MENNPKLKRMFAFLRDEAGAVTVDWVVLTAAVVGFGAAVIVNVKGGSEQLASKIDTSVRSVPVAEIK